MQLSYRGLPYQSLHRAIETVESEIQGQFLGQPYLLHRPAQPSFAPRESLKTRKYRGVAY
jgi:Domain of unknown function (DUF4278)